MARLEASLSAFVSEMPLINGRIIGPMIEQDLLLAVLEVAYSQRHSSITGFPSALRTLKGHFRFSSEQLPGLPSGESRQISESISSKIAPTYRMIKSTLLLEGYDG